METENLQTIHCESDGEYRVYCVICDKLSFERFYRNRLESKTHTKKIR